MRIYSLLLIFLILISWQWLISQDSNPAKPGLIFSHEFHLQEAEVECSVCHQGALSSTTGSDNLLPEMDVCADCHDVEDEENCTTCHTNAEEPQPAPRLQEYSSKFNHEKHLAAGLECLACHAGVAGRAEVSVLRNVPGMAACMTCHEGKGAPTTCLTCHEQGEDLRPASHTINFRHAHSDLARNDSRGQSAGFSCNTCHQSGFCQDCHEGENLDRRTHALNFEFTHALQARGKEAECATCHTEREFCTACHNDRQVMPHNHTAGWAIQQIGGRHKAEAENDLENCMTCHEHNAEQICQPCHSK